MDKQIAELIKTLNGGLKQLPDLAKEMIHQYVVGHAVIAGLELVLAIILSVIGIKLLIKWLGDAELTDLTSEYKKAQAAYDKVAYSYINFLDPKHDEKQSTLDHEKYDKQKKLDFCREALEDKKTGLSFMGFSALVCGVIALPMYLFGLRSVYEALTPIWSIIKSLT